MNIGCAACITCYKQEDGKKKHYRGVSLLCAEYKICLNKRSQYFTTYQQNTSRYERTEFQNSR